MEYRAVIILLFHCTSLNTEFDAGNFLVNDFREIRFLFLDYLISIYFNRN